MQQKILFFIAKKQKLLSIKVRRGIFALMNYQNEFYKSSEEPFFRTCYNTVTQRELYECHYKIIKIIEGSIVISGAGKVINGQENSYLFVNKGEFSKIKMTPAKNGRFELLGMNFTDKFLKTYSQNNFTPNCTHKNPDIYYKIKENILLKGLFASLQIYAENPICLDKKLTNLKLEECIRILFLTEKELTSYLFSHKIDSRKELPEFMNANYMFNAPLERFAEFSGRSLSTFRRDFIKTFGMTPNKWLMDKRLEAAYRKIADEKQKPSDIYWEVGFETLAHFSRKFKEQYHITPSQLKQQKES